MCSSDLQRLFSLPNVEMVWDSTVECIEGLEQVDGVRVRSRKTGDERAIAVSGVFIAIGLSPLSEAFAALVETDEKGYIAAGEDCRTNVPGIFVAGDIRTKKLRQVVTAAADGANAVASVEEYFLSS